MTEINPYQSPLADSVPPKKPSPEVGIWRKGSRLMVHRDARLPDICLKTGRPADRRISKKVHWITWLDDGDYFVELPVSNRWWRRHVLYFRIALVVGIAGIGMMLISSVFESELIRGSLIFGSLAPAGASLLLLWKWGSFIDIKHGTQTHVFLARVHRDVLNRFPKWPG